MSKKHIVPMIGFAAYSGTGKTTLLKKLIPELKSYNLSVAVIKHAHHTFEIDYEGKDSYELRKAGADQLLIGSKERWALIVENPRHELSLEDYMQNLNLETTDLILVEGFKPEKIPKIELFRPSLNKEPFYTHDDSIIAVATDNTRHLEIDLPVLDLNNPKHISEFIIKYFKLSI